MAKASHVVQVVKNSPAKAVDIRDAGLIPGQEDHLEDSMATHSSILVESHGQRIPWAKSLTRLKQFRIYAGWLLHWVIIALFSLSSSS